MSVDFRNILVKELPEWGALDRAQLRLTSKARRISFRAIPRAEAPLPLKQLNRDLTPVRVADAGKGKGEFSVKGLTHRQKRCASAHWDRQS